MGMRSDMLTLVQVLPMRTAYAVPRRLKEKIAS